MIIYIHPYMPYIDDLFFFKKNLCINASINNIEEITV